MCVWERGMCLCLCVCVCLVVCSKINLVYLYPKALERVFTGWSSIIRLFLRFRRNTPLDILALSYVSRKVCPMKIILELEFLKLCSLYRMKKMLAKLSLLSMLRRQSKSCSPFIHLEHSNVTMQIWIKRNSEWIQSF